jgi:effector-binding domain-containing protein
VKKTVMMTLSVLAMLAVAVATDEQTASGPDSGQAEITVRTLPAQTVLYTIVRGPYQKTSQAVGGLYALAGQKGLRPMGPPTYTYLNNPNRISGEHWLTEIRTPIGDDALKLAGTLGDMTDVKQMPAVTVAVAIKPEGMADSSAIYGEIYTWAYKNGYRTVDSPSEVFLTNAAGGDYTQMKSEIMMPVGKMSACDK